MKKILCVWRIGGTVVGPPVYSAGSYIEGNLGRYKVNCLTDWEVRERMGQRNVGDISIFTNNSLPSFLLITPHNTNFI